MFYCIEWCFIASCDVSCMVLHNAYLCLHRTRPHGERIVWECCRKTCGECWRKLKLQRSRDVGKAARAEGQCKKFRFIVPKFIVPCMHLEATILITTVPNNNVASCMLDAMFALGCCRQLLHAWRLDGMHLLATCTVARNSCQHQYCLVYIWGDCTVYFIV